MQLGCSLPIADIGRTLTEHRVLPAQRQQIAVQSQSGGMILPLGGVDHRTAKAVGIPRIGELDWAPANLKVLKNS